MFSQGSIFAYLKMIHTFENYTQWRSRNSFDMYKEV